MRLRISYPSQLDERTIQLAEEVGFEPTGVVNSQMLSRQRRYDHFGTPPYKNSLTSCLGREITLFRE